MADVTLFEDESYEALTEGEKAKLREIREGTDFGDPNAVFHFGTGVQSKISDFADTILSELRVKDTDYVGKILSDLLFKIKELQVEGLGGGFFSKIPFVRSFVDGAKKFMAGYGDMSVQIVRIVEELEKAKAQLLRDVVTLDRLYEKNIEYFKELNLYILAGKMKLLELRETVIPPMEAHAEKSNDPADVQRYRDMVQLAARIEKKLHDLRLSRTVALQTAPQIRLVQNNNQELAEKIQSSILNTVPLWKNQVIIAVSLLRQRNILEIQQGVSETTRELLEKNAEMIRESSAGIAREAERGIVDIETLKKVNADLIGTIEETLKIQQEGIERRKQAGEELEKIEKELKAELLRIRELRERDFSGKGSGPL